jgi:hypothetical protein
MSLVSQITALAARIADEFNSVRSEISALPTGDVEYGNSFPTSPRKGQMFFMDDEQIAYIYGGSNWIPLMPVGVYDGGTAELGSYSLIDGGNAPLVPPIVVTDGGDA